MKAGDNWVLGDGFVICLSFFANSYNICTVSSFTKNTLKIFNEFKNKS